MQSEDKARIPDPFSTALEDFFKSNKDLIVANDVEERGAVLQEIRPHIGSYMKGASAHAVLSSVFKCTEERFCEICKKYSFDDLMAVLRRVPVSDISSTNVLTYLSLGFVKFADPHMNTTKSFVQRSSAGRTHGMVHVLTEEFFFDALKLLGLAGLLDEIAGVIRWVGKGAQFFPFESDLLHCLVPQEVGEAVLLYESRRFKMPLRDQGLLLWSPKNIDNPQFFMLGGVRGSLCMEFNEHDLQFRANYLPVFVPWTPVARVLESYRAAIEKSCGVSVEAIGQFFWGVSGNIWNSILWPEEVRGGELGAVTTLVMPKWTSDEVFTFKAGFSRRLLLTGYMRLSRDRWIEALANVFTPWAVDLRKRKDLVAEFFAAFAVTRAAEREIDLTVLRPTPLLVEAPSGEFYLDFCATADFFRDVVEKAKFYQSSQHGDLFTLNLEARLLEEVKGAQVLGTKKKIRGSNEKLVECDLLVSAGHTLFVIECKAHGKSQAFFRGDKKAVSLRDLELRGDYRQAQRAADAVNVELARPESKLPAHDRVEFCVCTPSQEFVLPADRFGWLAEGVPRICTPEELVRVVRDHVQAI